MADSKNTPYIFGDNFLLQSKLAEILYHDYAEKMPIIDYHCHLPVQQIENDYRFENLTDIWLRGDHYKWRAMRALGVDETYITGSANDEEKFMRWAEIVPKTLRNPLFHWTHMELKNPFGIKSYLNGENGKNIYGACNAMLAKPEFSARGLLSHFNVGTVCTTDDPIDNLEFHQSIKQSSFDVSVYPAWRPDNALIIWRGDDFRAYIQKLSDVSGIDISDFEDLLAALQNRIEFFGENDCTLADHGLNYIPIFDANDNKTADQVLKSVLNGANISEKESAQFTGLLLYKLCRIYSEKGWVQQFHLGALRDVNENKLNKLGPATGFDSIGDFKQAEGLGNLLNLLEKDGHLTKTILYNLNPADNEIFATMAGNFNEGPTKGKIQYGAAWWFLDQLDGMEKQINTLSNLGILSSFVGMLTDSRSFLSYSRHEYFRRLLCNLFAKDVEAGLLPNDEKWLGTIIEDLCYNNASAYFGWK